MTELKIAAAVISTGLFVLLLSTTMGSGVGFRPAGTPLRLTGLIHNARMIGAGLDGRANMANMKDALRLTMFAIRLVAVLVTMEARTPWVVGPSRGK